ncbi:MAG: caspase family protein [Candidatus Thiothrix putei]|uniref:Caspase family protein n=1 Tax=Candidatus Thiothrix putei TaxID=3080811 RepID=A0AA95HDX0_9GAMM|nr:MAG: caspase family protein [Candidatus Thiothrix putei]
MAVYGLLVGINHYQSSQARTLYGCENDVYLFSNTLQKKFGIPPENIDVLLSAQATRQNIIGHFQQHLLGRDWQAEDSAVFYFSGHGAQTLAPEIFWDMEPDHLNESLVCHDSRTAGIPDLRDKELRYLIAQLAANHCQHIVVLLDCCHGGHGTRVLGDKEEEWRLAPVDTAEYPLDSFIFWQQAGKTLDQAQLKSLIPASGKHILLSGCQDFQVSIEKAQGSVSSGFQKHGLFTFALCETLSALQYPISYQELRNHIHLRLQSKNFSQVPQIEAVAGADVTQVVLGVERLSLRILVSQEAGEWKLDAGMMHGLHSGDELALFGKDAAIGKPDTCLTTARIQQVGSFNSTLLVNDAAVLKVADQPYTAIITRQHFAKTAIRLQGDASSLQEARAILQAGESPADPGCFLKEEEQLGEAHYIVHAQAGAYYLTQTSDTRPLFKKADDALKVLEQAASLARWQQKRDLHNPQTRLGDPVEMVVTYDAQEYINEDVTLKYTFNGSQWEQPRFHLELRLKPNQPPLYYALLYFDGSTGEVSNVLASGGWLSHEGSDQENQLKAQPKVKAREGKVIPLKIKDELLTQGITRIQDSLKLIVCESIFDSSLLNQPGLQLYDGKAAGTRSLMNSLEQLAFDSHFRSLGDEVSAAPTDWTSKVINLTVIRPQESKAVPEQDAELLLQVGNHAVYIEPHPAFRGMVRLTAAHQENSRGMAQTVYEPSVLSADASVFTFSDGRGADLGLDALDIYLTRDAAAVSPANPLTLSINQPLAAGEQIIPYVYDSASQFFLPLGYATTGEDGRTFIRIESLPEAAATTPDDGTKSLGSALKVLFRKLVYRDLLRIDEEIHVLGTPRFAPNDPARLEGYTHDKPTVVAKAKDAQRILLLIHGIIGHSSAMVGCVNLVHSAGQAPLGAAYDLILTFDYENLNTRIQDVAKALKAQLEQAGITPEGGKRIDILAHSMGGLVARWFIEREGGDQLVNTLVMVGTPNGGSPLASFKEHGYAVLKTWAYSNLVAILNGLTTVAVGGVVVAALMKLLDAVDNTLDQLAPDSDFIHELANAAEPANVRYRVVAGDTSGQMIAPGRHMARLSTLLAYLGQRTKLAAYDLLTEKLFKEANDMAVGHGSMVQFNPVWQAAVTVEPVQCDHLSYFADPAAVQKIAQQLRA